MVEPSIAGLLLDAVKLLIDDKFQHRLEVYRHASPRHRGLRIRPSRSGAVSWSVRLLDDALHLLPINDVGGGHVIPLADPQFMEKVEAVLQEVADGPP